MKILSVPAESGRPPRHVVLDWIVGVEVRPGHETWLVVVQPMLGEAFPVQTFRGASSMGGRPDYPEIDARAQARAEAFAQEIANALAAMPAPTIERVSPECVCVICDLPIVDGHMVGAGDGTGQRFAHKSCWVRQVDRETSPDTGATT